MLKLNVLEILKNKGKSKYWLSSQLKMTYTNYNNLVTNRTKSIKYEHIEKLCEILECTPNDLFTIVPDSQKSPDTSDLAGTPDKKEK